MLIVSNWKAYVDTRERAAALVAAAKRLSGGKRISLVLAPSAPLLGIFAHGNRSKVRFAAQDVSTTTVGAATGEVSAGVLRGAGATYVILGHSERRAMGESDGTIAEKVRRALANKLTPILCIGETERDADAGYLRVLREQIRTVFEPLSPVERLKVVIAYEPVWAIGKSAEEAIAGTDLAEMVLYIRKVLGEFLMGKSAQKIPILYGGSVDASNARDIAGGSRIDGFLVGRASTDPKSFTALVKAVS